MDFLNNIHFLNKQYFFLLILLLIVPFFCYFISKRNSKKIYVLEDMQKIFGKINYFFIGKIVLIILILIFFIILLADPYKINISEKVKKNGIDIVFALDISESMNAEDLKPTRIEAAKKIIQNFLQKMKTNRVGLVIFAGKPLSSIPLTFDYNILDETIKNTTTSSLNQNISGFAGTAVGDAILMSKNLFKDKDREKVIILLTDGDSNRGVNPVLVAKIAKKEKIKIYTIGIGDKKNALIKVKIGRFIKVGNIPPLNEKPLKEVAKITSGEFFRARDNNSFEKIFEKLEKLEKNDIEIKILKTNKEYYNFFVFILFILLFILFFLENKKFN